MNFGVSYWPLALTTSLTVATALPAMLSAEHSYKPPSSTLAVLMVKLDCSPRILTTWPPETSRGRPKTRTFFRRKKKGKEKYIVTFYTFTHTKRGYCSAAGPVFSLRYIVCFGLIEMAIDCVIGQQQDVNEHLSLVIWARLVKSIQCGELNTNTKNNNKLLWRLNPRWSELRGATNTIIISIACGNVLILNPFCTIWALPLMASAPQYCNPPDM